MEKDKDERKRSHLRLVVNNPELRNPRPAKGEEPFIPLDELAVNRDGIRPDFYQGMGQLQHKCYGFAERFLARTGWMYGLDPRHGRLIVIAADAVCPEILEHGGTTQDELLLFVTEDAAGQGPCLTLEMILPFWSDDDSLMEEALLTAPILPYGMLFLEENRNDGYLDLIYRLAFPLLPPALTGRLLEKLFAVARFELRETLRTLDAYPSE